MSLAIDTSTPAHTAIPITSTSSTTNAFSPPANSVIFLMVSVNGASNTSQKINSVTDTTATGLTWTQLVLDNIATAALGGCTTVWYAPCPSAQTAITVTANFNISTGGSGVNGAGSMIPVVFTGAAMKQTGNTSVRNSATAGTPSQTLVTQFDNSWVFAAIQDWTNATSPTTGGSQTNTINGDSCIVVNATSGDGWWIQSTTAQTNAQGTTVTINDTAPATIVHHFAIVEVMAQQPLPQNYQGVKIQDNGNGVMSAGERIR